jgi:PmbA protein
VDPRETEQLLSLASQVVERALAAGATVAEAVAGHERHLSAKVRLGKPEVVEEAGSRSLGVRVMVGQQVAATYTSDLSEGGLARFVEDALELARLAQPDAFAGPPDPALLSKASEHVELDQFDPSVESIDAERALQMALVAERTALAVDKRLTNSEGASVSRHAGASALVTSGGFRATRRGTYASIVVSPVADDADDKKRVGYHWSSRRHLSDLESPEAVGLEAARRTLEKLGPRKLETQEVPVVFDPDAARSVLGLLAGCVTGGAIWRKSSFLCDRLGERIASDLVTVIDDPFIPRGPGSQAFDGEGLLARKNVVVEAGVLKAFLLDTYSGKKLGMPSTANAARGSSGGVGAGTTNFVLQPGIQSAPDLLRSTERALYVTSMMGYGFNAVTGDFSRGASGFWLERGERIFPVSEVTISLNLGELLKRIDAVASDIDHRSSICAPTFRVSAMTVAGR